MNKEVETAEMMGKFKDLGNTILGKFGMNLDQFQFEKNDAGSYNLNIKR